MKELEIWDTDRFFTDSPNTGEITCICSRCGHKIKQGAGILRVPVDSSLFIVKNEAGKPVDAVIDGADGYEFRLCRPCLIRAGLTLP